MESRLKFLYSRWKYRKEFNHWLEERNLKHKKNTGITGNMLWLDFVKDKTGEASFSLI